MFATGNEIFWLSTGIWQDIGSPDNLSVSSISGRLMSSGMLGGLDNLLIECHWVDWNSGTINPSLNGGELNIYQQYYKVNYYRNLASQIVGKIGNPASFAYVLREGDSNITLSNPVDIARLFRDLEKQAMDELKLLVFEYRKGKAGPRAVNYPTIETPGVFMGGFNTFNNFIGFPRGDGF